MPKLSSSIRSRFLASLDYLEYRKLWGATLCSQSAAWALIIARMAWVLHDTDSAVWTGAVTFAAMIPSVVVSPIAGYLSDRFDRRTVLAWAYSINLAHNVLLAVLVAVGWAEAWHVLLLAVVNGSARATQIPSSQALLANTVPRSLILNAVSLLQAIQQGSRFIGPFLILVVLWITGNQDLVFFVCAGLYAAGFVLVLSIRTVSRGVIEAGSGAAVMARNMVEGIRYIYRSPLALSIVGLVVAHCALTMSFESLFPVLSRDKLGLDDAAGILSGASYLMVGFGGAALVTSLGLAGVTSERGRGRLFLWTGVLSGLAPVALAMSPNLTLAVLSAAVMGSAQGGFMTLGQAMVQSIAPDAIRGRVMGVYTWHIQGFMASFNLLNGALAGLSALTAPIILGAGGLGFVVIMAFSFARYSLRHVYAQGVPIEARAEVPSKSV